MVYERIQKPNPPDGAGISPSRLRAILLGLEKKRKEEEEEEAGLDGFVSESDEIDDFRTNVMESSDNNNYKKTKQLERESSFQFHKLAERGTPRSPLILPFSKPSPSKWDDAEKWIASPTSNRTGKSGHTKKSALGSKGTNNNRQGISKVVVEVPDTKRIDTNHAKIDANVDARPDPVFDESTSGSPISLRQQPQMDSSTSKSVSMRDMGTEMTPIPSHEPSRTGTPVRDATQSPASSRSLSPIRTAESSNATVTADPSGDSDRKELSEEEQLIKARKEIMELGQQLGKTNITAWAKEEENNASSKEERKSDAKMRAAAWEEAEKLKYLARFKQEEINIQAWENLQKAKTEAAMRKIEVEVERMRARANEKLMNKLASVSHKANEKRSAAESRKNSQAAKTAKQVEFIKKTGRVPSSSSFFSWCA